MLPELKNARSAMLSLRKLPEHFHHFRRSSADGSASGVSRTECDLRLNKRKPSASTAKGKWA